jgi:predicted PurR-regulated permease PerM
MKAAEELLVPLVLASFLAVLTAPAVLWLQRKRWPSWLAVSTVLLGVMILAVLLGTILGSSVNGFVAAVPRYQFRLNAALGDTTAMLEGYGIAISSEHLRQLVNPAAAMRIAGELVTQFASVLSDTALIILTLGFVLLEVASIPRKLRRAMGRPDADLSRYTKIVDEVKRYVVIKTYLSIATGLVIGIFVGLMGVDFPVLWGLVAFLLNYIPNVGSIVAAVPPVLLAMVQFGPASALGTAAGYAAVNTVFGNILEPRLMGRKLGLSTLIVFLSLIFWGWLWGPMGMLLSVPLTMIVKILLESSEHFGRVALLMDPPMSQRRTAAETPPPAHAEPRD